nr:hypothetical protein CFP56_40078 [Quercus suber]
MGKKRIRIVNSEIEPQPQDPSHGSLGPDQSQDTLPLDHSLGPSANRSSALLVPQPQADDNSDEESTNIEVQIIGIVAEAPSTVNRQDFATLVNFWFSKDGLERSRAGKKASKKKKDVHTAGSKSYAQHAFDMFKKDGVAPNRGKLYVKLHKEKDGMPVNEDASEKIDKLKELMSQEASDLPKGANGSIAWCSIDAFSKVMGKEKHGRVRGLGFGPTPSNRSGSKIAVMEG